MNAFSLVMFAPFSGSISVENLTAASLVSVTFLGWLGSKTF